MSFFGDALQRLINEKGLSQLDVEHLTSKQVLQARVSDLLKGKRVPTPKQIMAIAKALKEPPDELSLLALRDELEESRDEYGVSEQQLKNLFIKKETAKYQIPLFDSKELPGCLSKAGYPRTNKRFVKVAYDYGPNTYALTMSDSKLRPKVEEGEVVVLTDRPTKRESSFGIVATAGNLFFGRVSLDPFLYSIQIDFPKYNLINLRHKDVRFFHRVVNVIIIP